MVPLKIALQWQVQSQFAGFYMALEQGYFQEAGLDVTLIHAGVKRPTAAMLADGSVQAGTMMLADAMVADLPVVLLLQLVQHSNLALVAWKGMGIEKPSDLNGQRVSLWKDSFSLAIDAFFLAHDLKPEILPQYRSIELFLQHGVAAASVMRYSPGNKIRRLSRKEEKFSSFPVP
jgi:NitT/TauT family transport system substrate-binding protein